MSVDYRTPDLTIDDLAFEETDKCVKQLLGHLAYLAISKKKVCDIIMLNLLEE